MSSLGLLATIFSVRAVSELVGEELGGRLARLYQVSRDLGLTETVLFEVADVQESALSELETQRIETAGSLFPTLEFVGALSVDPAFPEETGPGSVRPPSKSDDEERLLYFWSDPAGTAIMLGQLDWNSDPGDDGEALTGEVAKPMVSGAIVFSRPRQPDADFIATIAIPGEIVLDENESLFVVDFLDANWTDELMRRHVERVGEMPLATIEPANLDVMVQDFLNGRAFAFVNRGGLSQEELINPSLSGLDEVPESGRQVIIQAFQLGWRNGVSKQFDRYVLERASRDVDLPSTSGSGESKTANRLVVIHPLCCPVRTRAILAGVDPVDRVELPTNGASVSVPAVDAPANLVETIESFAASRFKSVDVVKTLESEVQSRPDCKEVFHMDEPFAATVFVME